MSPGRTELGSAISVVSMTGLRLQIEVNRPPTNYIIDRLAWIVALGIVCLQQRQNINLVEVDARHAAPPFR